ncbi:MAG: MFS transporter [Bacteroidales bacterium]|jgi:ACS family hexuronate transporter-like MFS transporter
MKIKPAGEKMTRYRWTICMMLFFATTVNYLDRQVLSLTWMDFIAPEFHWTNVHYGKITGIFSIMYAIGVLFAGRIIDRIDTKKGYLWAIGIWSVGACLHALCGVITEAAVGLDNAWALRMAEGTDVVARITTVSVSLFIFARSILALGEAGNFPAAVKATAEYFPKKDRGFATSIFNAGATVGALVAPVTVPLIATRLGWEAAFLIIGALGFIWMGFWIFIYKKPEVHPKVNRAELMYIQQDGEDVSTDDRPPVSQTRISFWKCLSFRQTWAFALGKFMTDGVWWFFLFWTPAYLSSVYDLPSNNPTAQLLIFVLYAITLLAIIGGWLPTYFVEKKKMEPYAGRMRAMLIFAFFPLLTMFAQPLGSVSYWIPVVIIGIAGAAHQAWSANLYSTIGDMFPKSTIATITGIGTTAGMISSYVINRFSGVLFDHAANTQMTFMGFQGEAAGYFIVFCICSVAYLGGWVIIKTLVPRYRKIIL